MGRTGLLYTVLAAIWTVLHSLVHGFNIAALNGVQDVVVCPKNGRGKNPSSRWGLNSCIDISFGFIVTIFTLGVIAGALSADRGTRWLGRMGVLRASEIGMVIGMTGVGISNSMWLMLAARLVVGFSSGWILVTVPLALAALAPNSEKTLFGTLHQIFIGVGMITAQSLSIPFAKPWDWRFVLIVGAGIATFLLASGFAVTRASAAGARSDESERQPLIESEADGEPRRGDAEVPDDDDHNKEQDLSVKELFTQSDPTITRGVFVVVVAQAAQQACGISAVMYFSTHILMGLFSSSAKLVSLAIMIVGIPFNFVPGLLPSWVGTKRLLLLSSLGTSLFALLLGIGLNTHSQVLAGVAVIGFVIMFSIGLAPLAWVVLPEVMPENARTATGSIGVSVAWIMNFVSGSTFLPLQQRLKHGGEGEGNVFFVLATASLVFTVLIFLSWWLLYRAQRRVAHET